VGDHRVHPDRRVPNIDRCSMSFKGIFTSISRISLVAITSIIGILILLGYFFPTPALTYLRTILLNWAVILTGVAVFLGVGNLLLLHYKKIQHKQKDAIYSIIMIVAMAVTLLLGLAGRYIPLSETLYNGIFNYVQLPIEASLMAILVVTLTYAAIRLLRRRPNLLSIVFLLSALFILFFTVSVPFLGEVIPGLSAIFRPVLSQVLAAAGARGILLGVALGILATGLRVLFGADRPYGGK
jgi:hypothetical protein